MAIPTIRKKGSKPRITAWSPSRLYDYEACPRKAKYKIIDRLEDPGSAAMQRGIDIHEKAEHYVSGRVKRIPKELLGVQKVAKNLRTEFSLGRVKVEHQFACTADWQPTEWFSPTAWLRLKIDVLHRHAKKPHVHVIDWKTGRYKPDDHGYGSQLHLYALSALVADQLAQTSTASLVFTDHGEEVQRPEGTLTRDHITSAQKQWEARVWPMLEDTRFDPHPGNACRWCPFSRSKGGPCEF